MTWWKNRDKGSAARARADVQNAAAPAAAPTQAQVDDLLAKQAAYQERIAFLEAELNAARTQLSAVESRFSSYRWRAALKAAVPSPSPASQPSASVHGIPPAPGSAAKLTPEIAEPQASPYAHWTPENFKALLSVLSNKFGPKFAARVIGSGVQTITAAEELWSNDNAFELEQMTQRIGSTARARAALAFEKLRKEPNWTRKK